MKRAFNKQRKMSRRSCATYFKSKPSNIPYPQNNRQSISLGKLYYDEVRHLPSFNNWRLVEGHQRQRWRLAEYREKALRSHKVLRPFSEPPIIDYSTFEEDGAFYEHEKALKKIVERTASHDPNAFLVEDDRLELALHKLYMDEVEARRDAAQEYDVGNEYDAYNSLHGDLLINGLEVVKEADTRLASARRTVWRGVKPGLELDERLHNWERMGHERLRDIIGNINDFYTTGNADALGDDFIENIASTYQALFKDYEKETEEIAKDFPGQIMDDLLPLIKGKLERMKEVFQPIVELAEAKEEYERMMREPSQEDSPGSPENEECGDGTIEGAIALAELYAPLKTYHGRSIFEGASELFRALAEGIQILWELVRFGAI